MGRHGAQPSCATGGGNWSIPVRMGSGEICSHSSRHEEISQRALGSLVGCAVWCTITVPGRWACNTSGRVQLGEGCHSHMVRAWPAPQLWRPQGDRNPGPGFDSHGVNRLHSPGPQYGHWSTRLTFYSECSISTTQILHRHCLSLPQGFTLATRLLCTRPGSDQIQG